MSPKPTELPEPGAPDVLYLIDLSGYIFRAYHAITPLTSPSGEPTHATYGTVAMLSKLVGERSPAYLAIAMDHPGRTFRDDIDARYKAHRPPAPEDLGIQMKRCREIVDAYRIPVFATEGLEADDLIAAITHHAKAFGLRVVIASSDKDLMQLVDDEKVMLWDAMRDKVYGAPEVVDKFGVAPGQVRDLLALVGDTSDNVPGVPGIGFKTAADLLNSFGSLNAIYASLDDVSKPRIRELLRTHESEARISQRLVTLHAEAHVNADFDAMKYGGADTELLRSLFTELGFSRLLKQVSVPKNSDGGAVHCSIVTTSEVLCEIAQQATDHKRIALEVHTTTRDAMLSAVCGMALACDKGRAWYVPLGHRYLGAPQQLTLADVHHALSSVLSDPSILKIGHDLKFASVVLRRHGIDLGEGSFDTMLASYVLDPEADHRLEALCERELGHKMVTFESVAPKRKGSGQRTLDEIEIAEAANYAAAFPDAALRISEIYTQRLRTERVDKLLFDLELPLSRVLAEMEYVGVLVDPEAFVALGKEMAIELEHLERKAHEIARQEFNVASPKQLEAILFDELQLRSTRRTKTGRSTDAEALEAIADDHPLPGVILEHRAIAKLKGTYVDTLPKIINPKTGRIHTRWGQAVAATGRLSSQDPNLQNIPIRSALGKMIRRGFVAPKGKVFVSADYSQIELRVLAHMSKDAVLLDAFRTGQDVHRRTAMEIFSVDSANVTDEMRRQSKTINFGVIYGMGEGALARRLGISRIEAAKFIDAYFERYSGVRSFMTQTMDEARRSEVVHTLLGRRRHLSDLRSSDRMKRAYAERIAQNTPIQGTAADLLKLAMVCLKDPVVPGAQMVLTVHDELAFEVPEDRVDEAAQKIQDIMEHVYPLEVPLVVDVGRGANWAEAH